VTVSQKHEINILTSFRSSPDQPVCDQLTSATYRPKGNSFEAADQDTSGAMCWGDSFYSGLNHAFKQAAGVGETLAIVQVLPALKWDKYALVLQRRSTGFALLRMDLNREDWSAPILLNDRATASECFSRAKSSPVNVKTLDISGDRAEALVKSLDSLDLRRDRCARGKDGQCAFLTDGREFYVQVGDHVALSLTDVKGMQGYTSENPLLSEWVYRLLDEAKH
jgi:hypothetical protein